MSLPHPCAACGSAAPAGSPFCRACWKSLPAWLRSNIAAAARNPEGAPVSLVDHAVGVLRARGIRAAAPTVRVALSPKEQKVAAYVNHPSVATTWDALMASYANMVDAEYPTGGSEFRARMAGLRDLVFADVSACLVAIFTDEEIDLLLALANNPVFASATSKMTAAIPPIAQGITARLRRGA